MANDKKIIIRVQAREGTKRIQANQDVCTRRFYELVKDAFGFASFDYQLYQDKERKLPVVSSNSKTLASSGIGHGDLMFLIPINGVSLQPDAMDGIESVEEPSGNISNSISSVALRSGLVEDEVDIKLKAQDGLIKRSMDSKLCRHDEKGACVFCAPLEPYDDTYLRDHNIKHLSFHSYLKKLTGGIDKGKFAALEDLNVSIKHGCPTHPPWPRGICSKCQPSAVTLNRQSYRHVDNVMFENPQIVENFIAYWRSSGHQRIGFLYGKFEEHPDVPLGIRARVAAIYEPPQESTRDKVRLLPDENENTVNEVAEGLGLKRVGWIFTDLIPEDVTAGTVKHLRGIHSYFLSAQECITAAQFQNMYPNTCKSAQKGTFGSKFATVLVTGDETHHVHMVGYQVSNQCMSLVRAKCLVPTKDAPEFGYVIDSSDKQYVPDVFFKQKDEYGNEVTRLGRPLPVEYLLVDVTVSTPKEPVSTFTLKEGVTPFPIENRYVDGSLQDFPALATYLSQFSRRDAFLRVASDFHFLIYIATTNIVHLKDYIGPLLTAVQFRNGDAAEEWSRSDFWATFNGRVLYIGLGLLCNHHHAAHIRGWNLTCLMHRNYDFVENCDSVFMPRNRVEGLIEASTIPAGNTESGNVGQAQNRQQPIISPQATWTCERCTFLNGGTSSTCHMCNLSRFS